MSLMYINHILSICADSADILNHFQKIERMPFCVYVCMHTQAPIRFSLPSTRKKKKTNHQVLCILLQKVNLLAVISLSTIHISIWIYKLIQFCLQLFPLPVHLPQNSKRYPWYVKRLKLGSSERCLYPGPRISVELSSP